MPLPENRRRRTGDIGDGGAAFVQNPYGGRVAPGDDHEWVDVARKTRRRSGVQSQWRTAVGSTANTGGPETPMQRRAKPPRFPTGTYDTPEAARNGKESSGKVRDRLQRLNPKRNNVRPIEPATEDISPPAMTNEMLFGTLSVMILKTWLDRDEEGHRAVPVLLGNLRFRIGDSLQIRLGKTGGIKEMFKIECEYGDGAIKWVIYRELRDFVSLHLHYKTYNFGSRVANLGSHTRRVVIPEFPRNTLPGWARKDLDRLDEWHLHHEHGPNPEQEVAEQMAREQEQLDEQDRRSEKQQQQQQPLQEKQQQRPPTSQQPSERSPAKMEKRQDNDIITRRALQQYLIDLIRAVMFRPESNILCIFFELSALTVALGPRGGFQGKAGFLKIPTTHVSRKSNQPGLKPSKWKKHHKPKWFIVRESFFVAVDGPAETDIYDVFLIDTDFTIERPKRAYRKGLKLLKLSCVPCAYVEASTVANESQEP